MSLFQRIADVRSNQADKRYSGLFSGGSRPVLHPAARARALIERALLRDIVIGRVTSSGHDIPVVEDRRISFIIPVSGSIRTELRGTERLAHPGEILIASRGRRVTRVTGPDGQPFRAFVLMMDELDLEASLQPFGKPDLARALPANFVHVVRSESNPEAAHLISLVQILAADLEANGPMVQKVSAQRSWQTILSDKLLALFQRENVLPVHTGPMSGTSEQHVRRAMEYLTARYSEITTVGDLADACEVSVRTLETAFRNVVEKSPWQVLTEWRLDEARRLLLSGSESATVTDVALECGFGHTGRFASAYKARFGESPSQTLRSSKS